MCCESEKGNRVKRYSQQRKFTFGIDGGEITHDALIKHQAIVLFYSTSFFVIFQPHSIDFSFS